MKTRLLVYSGNCLGGVEPSYIYKIKQNAWKYTFSLISNQERDLPK